MRAARAARAFCLMPNRKERTRLAAGASGMPRASARAATKSGSRLRRGARGEAHAQKGRARQPTHRVPLAHARRACSGKPRGAALPSARDSSRAERAARQHEAARAAPAPRHLSAGSRALRASAACARRQGALWRRSSGLTCRPSAGAAPHKATPERLTTFSPTQPRSPARPPSAAAAARAALRGAPPGGCGERPPAVWDAARMSQADPVQLAGRLAQRSLRRAPLAAGGRCRCAAVPAAVLGSTMRAACSDAH